jgi:hypothetical protein
MIDQLGSGHDRKHDKRNDGSGTWLEYPYYPASKPAFDQTLAVFYAISNMRSVIT